MDNEQTHGIVRLKCRADFPETVARLVQALQRRNLKLIAEIDHSADASSAGLLMPNTKLFIFGNPVAGTPVMLAAPSSALDLPLKALVSEDDEGVWISYNNPEYLRERHGFSDSLLKNISGIREICKEAT